MSTLRVVYTADQIHRRLEELVAEIASDYEGKELTLVGILKGSAFLLADISRLFNVARKSVEHQVLREVHCRLLCKVVYDCLGDVKLVIFEERTSLQYH